MWRIVVNNNIYTMFYVHEYGCLFWHIINVINKDVNSDSDDICVHLKFYVLVILNF